jgi:antitoxin component YwqK of YwqJK toxin-antitoxin module
MKKILLMTLIFSSYALFAAKSTTPHVLQEVYEAKYIGNVSEKEWIKRGSNGQIVTTLSDGSTISKAFALGKLNGKTIYTYPHTKTPKITEEYENDILVSKTEHYSSGVQEVQKEYEKGQVIKISRWYFDGSPQSIEEFKGNFLTSSLCYNQGNQEACVKEGHGTFIVRDSFGNLISKDTIAAGEVAEKSLFFPNGELKQITPYFKGQIHGHLKTYLAGGQPFSIEEWRYGQKHGNCLYFENGTVSQLIPYVEGKKQGIEVHYQDHMRVVEEITWKKGKRHGLQVTYINGQPHEQWYHEDKSVNKLAFNLLNLPSQKS